VARYKQDRTDDGQEQDCSLVQVADESRRDFNERRRRITGIDWPDDCGPFHVCGGDCPPHTCTERCPGFPFG
jgi:hypothetical protein